MCDLSTARPDHASSNSHDDFLALLPVVERHARVVFRDLKQEAREEAKAEAIAAAFQTHVRLKERGRNAAEFPSMLATYSVLYVKNGRHVGGSSSTRDVLSPRAQQRRGFRVERLSNVTRNSVMNRHGAVHGQREQDAMEECLRDSTQTPVPEQVAFRLDFPAFLQTLAERDRRMALVLADGHAAKQVAGQFGVSPARVTQLRQQWQREWLIFQGEVASPQAGISGQGVCS